LTHRPPRTFGFEYEFLPRRPLAAKDLQRLERFFRNQGYVRRGGQLVCGDRRVVFEPGGQIEYLSPPLRGEARDQIEALLHWINQTNRRIRQELSIEYVATGYLPGRGDSRLLLDSPRYVRMHERFGQSGTRGREMMKGTAAIHLHAAILSIDELAHLYAVFCRLARSSTLGISGVRQDIWAHTDPCRCGYLRFAQPAPSMPDALLQEIVSHALDAVELGTGRPFRCNPKRGEQAFLDHLTTIFTHVRLNLKGGTLELRTLDSTDPNRFLEKWQFFVSACGAM
jgi:glutamate--cysteine ligase